MSRQPYDASVYLRAIEVMMAEIDARLPDESLAPKPYEISATEMRDVVRFARRQHPLTKVGRRAWTQAVQESFR